MEIFMRKIIFFCIFLALATFACADKLISFAELPQTAQNFINEYFPNIQINQIEIDSDDYEVNLGTGIQIDFDIDGNWDKIKSLQGLPATLVPTTVIDYINENYPNNSIIEIEKNRKTLDITLKNKVELKFTLDGDFINKKWDT